MDWLKLGDRNTKFSHACANQRRKSNRIMMIKNTGDLVLESPDEIRAAFIEYFT